ncbi:amino acid permease [Flavihumibacter petaseus]|uniref:Arginine/agmatine antiporter n=1 Tax=Flavihumibacter petaseus NBRC 106054 TaxID=1220578 RepID=A0A0E9MW07_9BACT|nr:amino acid permease [Flavihumibacter petaseus]GAO41606.1 putative amino acid transporter [Flavihumibacter petaseus NBRC 106054]
MLTGEKKLGQAAATSLVVGNMIGAGIFLLPSALAAYGSISLLGWIFSSAGALVIAMVFSRLSRLLPGAVGGPYAFAHKGFGDFAGFLVAWGYWISIWSTNAAIAVSLVSALSTFFPVLATSALWSILTGLCAIWLLTWVNTLGIVASGRMQLITTLLKIIPLLLIGIAGLFFIRAENFHPFNSSGQSYLTAITATATLSFFALLGIECATIPGDKVKDPQRVIPKATLLGTLLVIGIYLLSSLSIVGMIPAEQLKASVTPFADAGAVIFGPAAPYWISAGVAIAAFGALNGWILVQGQIPQAIARDNLFPSFFARQNKYGVPQSGIVLSSVFVSVLMYMNYQKALVEQFRYLILLSTFANLFPYILCAAAYILLRLERPYSRISWIGALVLGGTAFLYSIWAMSGAGQETVYWGFLLLICGTPFYVWNVWKKRKKE